MGFNHSLRLTADNIGIELFEVVAHYFIPLSIGIGSIAIFGSYIDKSRSYWTQMV